MDSTVSLGAAGDQVADQVGTFGHRLQVVEDDEHVVRQPVSAASSSLPVSARVSSSRSWAVSVRSVAAR